MGIESIGHNTPRASQTQTEDYGVKKVKQPDDRGIYPGTAGAYMAKALQPQGIFGFPSERC